MWYLVMFFRYSFTRLIGWEAKLFERFFCKKGYHCNCYFKGERCCECESYQSESKRPYTEGNPVNISER